MKRLKDKVKTKQNINPILFHSKIFKEVYQGNITYYKKKVIKVKAREISQDQILTKLFIKWSSQCRINPPSLPIIFFNFTLINKRLHIGFFFFFNLKIKSQTERQKCLFRIIKNCNSDKHKVRNPNSF